MGREVKRVALDFKWALKSEWSGYVNPYFAIGICRFCGGEDEKCDCGVWVDKDYVCIHPSFVELYTQWERIEPPGGDGFQLWETVSEGSPVSPVFETRNQLVNWMKLQNYAKWAIASVENGEDWLPSAWVIGIDESDGQGWSY